MSEVLLVASAGGHLEQLKFLSGRLPFDSPRRWITFDTPQSRSLLQGEEVDFVPYMGPRDYRGFAENLGRSIGLRSPRDAEAVVSTGAGLALAYLPASAARGIPTHYIESATRVTGPSLTGRVLSRVPGVRVYSQYQHWADTRWTYEGSIFQGFKAIDHGDKPDNAEIKRAVVSLGTIRPYGFRRLIERLIDLFDEKTEVIWQTGATKTADLPIDARSEMPHHELVDAIKSADLLVAHAGTGIALTAFQAGTCPVLVPREAAHREHVDDHQQQIANLLGETGLAVSRKVDVLEPDDLRLASSMRVIVDPSAARLPLRI